MYPFTGVNNSDGSVLLEPWGTSANQATMSADSSVTDSPVGGVPLKMQMSGGNDPYTNTYNSTSWNITEAAQGEEWTFSVYVKSNQRAVSMLRYFYLNVEQMEHIVVLQNRYSIILEHLGKELVYQEHF